MEVAQNDETNPDTQPVRPPHIPSIVNTQLFLSGSSVRKRGTPGILSRMFPPFVGITSYRIRSHPAHLIAMLCFVVLCLLYIYCFFPLFSPLDPDTDAALVIDYVDDDPSLPGQPGKLPPPLITR